MENNNIEFILEELYKKYTIPIVIIDKKNKENILFPNIVPCNDNELKLSIIKFSRPDKTIILEKNGYFFSVFESNSSFYKDCYILIGPHSIINIEDILYKEFDVNKNSDSLLNEKQDFISFVELIFSILNDRIIDETDIEFISQNSKRDSLNILFQKNFELRKSSDIEHDSIELEKRLIDSIIQNDFTTFKWIFNQMHKTYFSRIHSDKLINLKYKYVGLVSILTRVSINNNIEKGKAYALSDSLIQQLEFIESLQECIVYLKESCILFMKLINSDFYSIKNPLVKEIYYYIDLHIYKKITLEELSDYCHKSKNYLSAEFKKYTGFTIHSYINQRKIKEARHILLFTNLSFTEIASKLSFSDQSHFIQKFKQIEGMTPKEYRQKYQSTKLM